jgi:molybdopterin converting factor subunit 1
VVVRLLFFAVLRDIVGHSELSLELPEGTRPVEVWNQLMAKHPQLSGYHAPPLTAVNQSYVDAENAVLHSGDELAFIPPVAGG